MAQFDVYRYAPRGKGFALVVDVQNDILSQLASRTVIPLYPTTIIRQPILRINPLLFVDGEKYIMATEEIAALHVRSLTEKIATLSAHRDEIIAAIDFLTTGV